jgi:restriction system protein
MNDPLAMTPDEFEIFVRKYLEEQGGNLKDFRTQHLEKMKSTDGDYVIDVTARFEALGADFLVLIECKRYTSAPVEREEVQALNQKRISLGAHKAMMFTTSSFRNGAIKFAAANRIALVQVTVNEVNYAVKSWLPNLRARLLVPESASPGDFLFDGQVPQRPAGSTEPEEVRVQHFVIAVLTERLDHLRIITSRGCEVDAQEIEDLKAEIAEEEAKLGRRRGGEE